MAQKKALTDEELLAQFEDLGGKQTPAPAATKGAKSASTKSSAAPAADDPLAELENLANFKPTSRPNTPKLSLNQRNQGGVATPSSTGSARTSEDKPRNLPRKSVESTRSYHQGLTPTSEEERAEDEAQHARAQAEQEEKAAASAAGGWGGWFSGITAAASAAAKQAEAAVKEIQKNEDAQKWAEQMRGNVGALRGLGGDLRSRALPTFTNLINTLAPPISQHERLQIHITHDLVGYPSLDPTIYSIFSRVMSQVEGGDLLVIQRGSEAGQRRASDVEFRGGSSGWNDGPWWRDGGVKRDLGTVQGLREGTKLVRISAESYSNEFFAARGGLEEAAKQATHNLSETNPVRSSDIFLAIQAIGYEMDDELFAGPTEEKAETGLQETEEKDEVIAFAVYLHDPIHGISFKAVSQAFPKKWIQWMDAENVSGPDNQLPEEIVEIIQSGGVDPREWVSEWLEEIISLTVGVVAQRYVARRMGVGEGGIGRGKAPRQELADVGPDEAARAGINYA
ncbi:hypothetical protein EG328_001377 [Venturia inaequalis]|uniref:Maintenance of telomere capping protein 1 n=1 Tax=Venturia inaequalis TaxID=5025 RepID=A0A8H3UXY8_VENIN|nr:hypothetical protein EG328_001377 [Venturia inaequalis]KAE9990584.1 hypothetical protein EG327_001227 [Venturia inaequalis]RDI82498.1 hypothetical protein Vi05172_g7470 [Venturia inaequalis]